MRILLTADTVGGVWDYTATLAAELASAGGRVLIAAIAPAADPRLSDVPPGVEVATRDLRLEWMPHAAADVAAGGEWIGALAASWAADVIHLNQFAYADAGLGGPALVVAHSDVLSWYAEVWNRRAPAEWAQYERWVRAGLAAADMVVAPSAYQSGLLARAYGRTADRVIWNGVPVPPDEPLESGTQPLLVTAGRAWDPAKGIRVLDEALAALGERAPAAVLLGDTTGPGGVSFSPRALESLGHVDKAAVNRWFARATIYVAPSLYEPFGLSPAEAALRRCALLLTDIGSFHELWADCAVYVPPGDPRALAAALAELVDDEPRGSALAAAAAARARAWLGAERMAREYMSVYERMLSGSGLAGAGRLEPPSAPREQPLRPVRRPSHARPGGRTPAGEAGPSTPITPPAVPARPTLSLEGGHEARLLRP